MQFIVISHQLWEIALSILLGLFFGSVYDCVRFFRRLLMPLRHDILFANIFDVIYLLFCGCCYCIFIYAASSGHFRWFTALGAALGFFIYRLLFSRVIMLFMNFIADIIKKLFMIVLYPFRMLILLARQLFLWIVRLVVRKHNIKKTEKMKNELQYYVKLS